MLADATGWRFPREDPQMIERKLSVPDGYDAIANPRIASFAAQLEDQMIRLKIDVEGLDVRQLEWQPHKGVNTIGMLLAHLAVVDLWWLHLAPRQTPRPTAITSSRKCSA